MPAQDLGKLRSEINFCRRCGTKLTQQEHAHHYKCEQGHDTFANPSPAVGVIVLNDKQEILLLVRAINPGKGALDTPGGFCDGPETLEAALNREMLEEVGLGPEDYSPPEFVLSLVDAYEYKDEILPVETVMFSVRLTSTKQPVAADDAASLLWVPLADVDPEAIFFSSVRAAIRSIVAKQSTRS